MRIVISTKQVIPVGSEHFFDASGLSNVDVREYIDSNTQKVNFVINLRVAYTDIYKKILKEKPYTFNLKKLVIAPMNDYGYIKRFKLWQLQ